jgi:AcrR family transcriptional regulator
VAAAQLFAEKGYSECNLRELADKVGMKAGSFYYHFRSKEEILDELLDYSIMLVHNAVTGAIAALGPDASVRDRLAAAIRAHITTFLTGDDNSTAFMRVWEHLPPTMKRRNREKRRAYAAIWYELMEQGVREGTVRQDVDLRLLVPFVIAGMSRTIEWYNSRRMTIEDVCEAVIRIHLEGGVMLDRQPRLRRRQLQV